MKDCGLYENVEATNQCNDVSGCHCENISAGDFVFAAWDSINSFFGFDHGVKAISCQGQIIRVVLLRLVASSRLYNYRGITTLQYLIESYLHTIRHS